MPVASEADDPASDLPSDITEAQARGEGSEDTELGVYPPEATFDYANPQLMLQQRMQQQQQQLQQQQQAMPTGAATPGTIIQPPAQRPNVFPGTAVPAVPAAAPTSARPGEVVQPQQQFNPYGLPAGLPPGSVQGPAIQPDRAKYLNPYQPDPSRPPE
jgi:hypothetical protein